MTFAAGAGTDAFRIAVYDTYDKAHPPETRPAGKRDGGYRLDAHAKLATDCWVYPIVSLYPSEENTHIPYELKIDPSGVVLHPVGGPQLKRPVNKRSKAFSLDPDHPYGVVFSEKVDAEGRPQIVRLFISPFRLGTTAIAQLCTEKYLKIRRNHLPYLWEWSTTKTHSPLKAGGYYLDETRTYLPVPQDDGRTRLERVWVGFEPFRNARRRSNLYVEAWTNYAKEHEPETTNIEQWRKTHFVELVHDSILKPDRIPAKYKKALNYTKLTDEYAAFKAGRTAKKQSLHIHATRLQKALLHPFFSLLQFDSLMAEHMNPKHDYNEALASQIDTLVDVTRDLGSTPEGIFVISRWIAESQTKQTHFVNQIVFPEQEPTLHIFKTIRWFSKSTLSVAQEIFGRVIAARNKTAQDVAKALFHVGIFATAEDALRGLKTGKLNLEDISKTLKLDPSVGKFADVDLLKVDNALAIQTWLEHDKSDGIPWYESKTQIQKRAFFFLDTVNVGLAWMAFANATTEQQRVTAGLNTIAAASFLGATFAEFVLEKRSKAWRTAPTSHKMWRVLRTAQFAGSIIFGVVNLLGAMEAFKKGDKTSGRALMVAAAADAVAGGVYLVQMIAGAPLFGGVLVAALIIGAISYTVALFGKIDPLELCLENCEYGKGPYSEGKYVQRWTGGQISGWDGDFRKQTRALIRVLTRFALSWKRDTKHPGMLQVLIECQRRTPDTRITVTFVAEFDGRKNQTEEVVLQYRDLADDGKAIPVEPKTDYIAIGAHRVTVHAQLELRHEGYDDSLAAILWTNDSKHNRDIHRVALVD